MVCCFVFGWLAVWFVDWFSFFVFFVWCSDCSVLLFLGVLVVVLLVLSYSVSCLEIVTNFPGDRVSLTVESKI